MHSKNVMLWWTWGVTLAIFLVIVFLSMAPLLRADAADQEVRLSPMAERLIAHEDFPDVANIILGRCSMCHGTEVYWPGLAWAPKGVLLDTDAMIASNARAIYLQAGASHAMPPGNLSYMEDAERAVIRQWYQSGVSGAL
jgi:uncharacterized membrane protein